MVVKIILLCVILLLIVMFFCVVPIRIWISAVASNVKVGIFNLVGMKLRRVPPAKIVFPLIKAVKAGIHVKVNQLEAHFMAGGNVDNVVNALIAAERAGMNLSFEIGRAHV